MRLVPDYRFTVRFDQDEDGVYIADCLDLRGCHAHGTTMTEARAMIREAIELHVHTLTKLGEPIPQLSTEHLDLAI